MDAPHPRPTLPAWPRFTRPRSAYIDEEDSGWQLRLAGPVEDDHQPDDLGLDHYLCRSCSRLHEVDDQQKDKSQDDHANNKQTQWATRGTKGVIVVVTPVPQVGIIRIRRHRTEGGGHRTSVGRARSPRPPLGMDSGPDRHRQPLDHQTIAAVMGYVCDSEAAMIWSTSGLAQGTIAHTSLTKSTSPGERLTFFGLLH